MKKLVIAILMTAIGCSDETSARKALDQQGFTDVQTTGYSWWGCGDGYATSTGFVAKNVHGKTVEGVVCCGGFKACTVRW